MIFFNGKPCNHINMSKDQFREVFHKLIFYFQAFPILKWEKFMVAIFKSLFIKVRLNLAKA